LLRGFALLADGGASLGDTAAQVAVGAEALLRQRAGLLQKNGAAATLAAQAPAGLWLGARIAGPGQEVAHPQGPAAPADDLTANVPAVIALDVGNQLLIHRQWHELFLPYNTRRLFFGRGGAKRSGTTRTAAKIVAHLAPYRGMPVAGLATWYP
jgi:hypothetical protein